VKGQDLMISFFISVEIIAPHFFSHIRLNFARLTDYSLHFAWEYLGS